MNEKKTDTQNDFEKVESPEITLITEEEEEQQKKGKAKGAKASFWIKLRNFVIVRVVLLFILVLTVLYFSLRTLLFAVSLCLSIVTLFKVDGIKRSLSNQWRHFKMSLMFFVGALVAVFNIGVGIGIVLAYFLLTKGKDLDSDFMQSLRSFLQRHANGDIDK